MDDLILGIDPGSRVAGFGLIRVEGDRLHHVDHGVIRLNEGQPLADRLHQLHSRLHEIYLQYPVRATVVEKVFFGRNADSAFKLGHARGVCLMVAAQNGSAIEEYAARYVKKAVTGSGAATKEHVQMVIFNLLSVQPKALAFDASDALSLAVTHARVRDVNAKIKKAMEGSP